jgi:WD repeat-containing protein 26
MESPEVAEFRQCILDASWAQAEAALLRIGVPNDQTLAVRRLILIPASLLKTYCAGGQVLNQPAEVLGVT